MAPQISQCVYNNGMNWAMKVYHMHPTLSREVDLH